VPVDELLRSIERGFAASRAAVAWTLAEVGAAAQGDDRVDQLRTPVPAFERARAMVRRARSVVLCDAFPAIEAPRPELAEAVKRGVDVAVKAYRPIDGAGGEVFVQPAARRCWRAGRASG